MFKSIKVKKLQKIIYWLVFKNNNIVYHQYILNTKKLINGYKTVDGRREMR